MTMLDRTLDPRLALVASLAAGGAAVASMFLIRDIPTWIVPVAAALSALAGGVAILGRWPSFALLLVGGPIAVALTGLAKILLFHDTTSWLRIIHELGDEALQSALAGGAAVAALVVIPARFARHAAAAPSPDAWDRAAVAASAWLLVVTGVAVGTDLTFRFVLGGGGLARGKLSWLMPGLSLALGAALAGAAWRRRAGSKRGLRALCATLLVANGAGATALAAALVVHARPLTGIVAVTLNGGVHYLPEPYACALHRDGGVWCWGANDDGQLGDGSLRQSDHPVSVEGVHDAVQIGTNGSSTCALRRSGEVVCWGLGDSSDSAHEQPHPSRMPRPEPVPGLPPVRLLGERGCALTRSDDVVCWKGRSWSIVAHAEAARSLVVAYFGGCAHGPKGLSCWARSERAPEAALPPCLTPAPGPTGEPLSGTLVEARGRLCEINARGSVRCWRTDVPRNLGHCEDPIEIAGIEGARRVAFTSEQICSVDAAGSMRCQRLVDPDRLAVGAGELVLDGVRDVVSDSATRMCAVRLDGTVLCWGTWNDKGELGDGTRRSRRFPTEVLR